MERRPLSRAGDRNIVAPIARLKLLATLTTAFSASAMVQYDGGSDTVIGNVRIRYNPREGTDIYLVYNEGLNTDRFLRIARSARLERPDGPPEIQHTRSIFRSERPAWPGSP